MPYCEKCGTQVNPEANFCKNCGAKLNFTPASPKPDQPTPVQQAAPIPSPTPVQQPVQAPPTPTPAPTPAPTVQAQPPQQNTSSGQVIGALVLKRPKSFGRYDTFTGVITAQQLIIAQMTSEMLKDTAMQARDQAKAQGKGFLGQWSEQLKASFGYTNRYLTMDPAAIIAETPGNFAIDNNSISEIKLKIKYFDQDNNRKEWEIEVRSFSGKYEFRMDDNHEYIELLKKVYPDRVKMPFGYFQSKGFNVKLF